MAVLFTCPNPHCPESDVTIEFVSDPGLEPQCECGAILDALPEPPMPSHSGMSPREAR